MTGQVKKLGCVSQDVGSKKHWMNWRRLHSHDKKRDEVGLCLSGYWIKERLYKLEKTHRHEKKRQEVGLCLSGCWIEEGLDELEKTPQP